MRNDLPMLKWAISNGCSRKRLQTVETLHHAVEHGNLEMIQYLHSKTSIHMNTDTFAIAAGTEEDRLDILQWLLEHGCPRDHRVYENAMEHDNQRIVQWVLAHHFPVAPS